MPPRPVRTVSRRLNEKERDDLEAKIQPWNPWIAQNKQALRSRPLDSLGPIFHAFFVEVTGHFHSNRSPPAPNILQGFRHPKTLLKQLPPAKSPDYQRKYEEFRKAAAKATTTHEKTHLTRVHRALVQDRRLKRSIAIFLEPDKCSDISLHTDAGKITDPKQVVKILGDTQQSLGADPHFVPDEDFVDSLLPQIPSAPAGVKCKKVPQITLAWLEDTLKKARPDKAGGGDRTNFYIRHLLPRCCKEALVSLTNKLMLQDLPQHWADANLAMLYKKGDPHSALNYRPFSLLNSCYKLIAKCLLAELDGLITQQ